MIWVFMTYEGLSLQQAVDRIGDMCKQTRDGSIENQTRVPLWGDGIDRAVKLYVDCLQNWFVGSLHWSFMTTRYFGDDGGSVKENDRIVDILPRVKA